MDNRGIVLHQDERVGKWVADQIGMDWFQGRGVTIGLENSKGELVAGAIYENYNGRNCFVHIAVKGRVTKAFLYHGFRFPFEELGCERITGMVASNNRLAVDLNGRLGMELEAVLYDAFPGCHILMYRMFKKDCKWLALGDSHGKQ